MEVPSGDHAPFPPDQFDDYEIVRPLGAGGMGTVFLGRDRMLDRPVALKFITDPNPDPRARERFLGEARAIARLHHPNVVGIYRIGTVRDRPYLAYELIDGQPLHHVPRPMSWRRALELGLGVARGLAAVHGSGVLHRDVKPANVVVGTHAKLIDFGLARAVDGLTLPVTSPTTADFARAAPHGRTSAGTIVGTPHYMAPELWHGAPPSTDSDVYALGLVVWELLGGELPCAKLGGPALTAAIMLDPMPAISTRRADVPAPFAELIARCLDHDPAARPSCAQLRDELEALRALYAPMVGSTHAFDDVDEAVAADELAASLARVITVPAQLATRFYDLAFAADPSLRSLFAADLRGQRIKIESALSTVVRNARAPELLVPLLEDLGERHAGFGVQIAHFDVIGEALLGAIAEAEGGAWTPALEVLWRRAYQRIADHMGRGLARAAKGNHPHVALPPNPWRQLLEAPPSRYARAGDAVIAYQVFGDGPHTIVVLPEWISNVELAWQEPSQAAFLSRLARTARIIVFDRRGCGLSDRSTGGLELDARFADLLAVLDAAGVERPTLFGIGDAAAVAAMFAATHPERVRGLILYGGTPYLGAGTTQTPAESAALLEARCAELLAGWGGPLLLDTLAPSHVDDDALRGWWARLLRVSATPSLAIAMLRGAAALDVRAALPAVRAPTLVLHRRGDRLVPLAAGQELARRISTARLVELDGDDHFPFLGDSATLLDAVDTVFTSTPTVPARRARLSTFVAVRPRADVIVPWRRVVTRLGGVVIDVATDAPVAEATLLLGTFTAPVAALRLVRLLGDELVVAAIHTEIIGPRQGGDDVAAIARAIALLADAEEGDLVVTAIARDLAGGELGPVRQQPAGADDGGGDDVRFIARLLSPTVPWG
ncbi:MAG: alpha/beta fold hydrolase [Proteobacteria bacterium]|nr:alpha/beta fold hydrolase [Pseudomonadota bacterium]